MTNPSESDLQQLIGWALATAGMNWMLHFAPEAENEQERAEKLALLEKGIARTVLEMPDRLKATAHAMSNEVVAEVEQNESIVEQFIADMESEL